MDKPKEIIFADGHRMSFKEFCIQWKAKYVWIDDIKYALPSSWLEEKNEC